MYFKNEPLNKITDLISARSQHLNIFLLGFALM